MLHKWLKTGIFTAWYLANFTIIKRQNFNDEQADSKPFPCNGYASLLLSCC